MTRSRDVANIDTILTTKGDIYAASAAYTPARLGVGSNGETLVADSSATTGLRWQGNFAAGKNVIINGDFRINQRSFSSTTNDNTYTFDRWVTYTSGTDQTYSAQTFTPGTAPVAGYEGANFLQIVTTAGATKYALIVQRVEDVRTFANQTMTISFWAKANTGTPKIIVAPQQFFGSGGSASVNLTEQFVTISTSWARYSLTFNVPSISGKTIGTGSYLSFQISFNNGFNPTIGQQANTFQIWGVQVESGSVATAFQTATGTLAGELAACQRYYYRNTATDNYTGFLFGMATTTARVDFIAQFPVPMRVKPTAVDSGNISVNDFAGNNFTITSFNFSYGGNTSAAVYTSGSTGLTAYRPYFLLANNNTSAYIAFNAEL